MARYIDADALIKKIFPYNVVDKRSYSINAQSVYKAIKEAPTEDVEPKSEVAREIFEEIETLLALNILAGDVFTGRYFDADLENDIAELKKKYAENENG